MEVTKIFRPWDLNCSKPYCQDSTISTTTDTTEVDDVIEVEDFHGGKKDQVPLRRSDSEKSEKQLRIETDLKYTNVSFTKEHIKSDIKKEEIIVPLKPISPIVDADISEKSVPFPYPPHYYPTPYPVYNPHFLGTAAFPESDVSTPFLDGFPEYALKEYARVMSQEHQAKLMNSRKQRPKKHICPHCQVGFSNNGQLKGHIRIHTGERPFHCDQKDCGKTFTRNEELTRHKRIHTGMRPFKCDICDKRFGRKDHLKKHARTHNLQQKGLQLVPVMLPASTWATIPPTAGMPVYHQGYHPIYAAVFPSEVELDDNVIEAFGAD